MQKSALDRFERNPTKLFGIYRGVVEDRLDPLHLGRVRVRVWGVHTEDQITPENKAPWDELQWAQPVLSVFGGSISDVGGFTVPVCGSHVFVFFESGNMMQPRYFASAPGFPIDAEKYSQFPKQDGFVDPDQWYPLDDHIDEADWHRLSKKIHLDETYLEIKKPNLDEMVGIAFGGEWDEQPPMYEAEYPDNNVWATKEEFDKNQVLEWDMTEGKQRLQYWHPSKSYIELNNLGRLVIRNSSHRWDICDDIKHVHTMKHHHEMNDDTRTVLIGGEEYREIFGKRCTRTFGKDWKATFGSDEYWTFFSYKRYTLATTHLFSTGSIKRTTLGSYAVTSISNQIQVTMNKMELASVNTMKMVGLAGREAYAMGDDTVLATGNLLRTATGVIHCKSSSNFLGHAPLSFLEGTAITGIKGGAAAGVSAPYCGVGGGLVQIGPTVQLGVTPKPVVPPAPISAPGVFVNALMATPPGDPGAPPGPADIIEYDWEDEPVEMPDPEC